MATIKESVVSAYAEILEKVEDFKQFDNSVKNSMIFDLSLCKYDDIDYEIKNGRLYVKGNNKKHTEDFYDRLSEEIMKASNIKLNI